MPQGGSRQHESAPATADLLRAAFERSPTATGIVAVDGTWLLVNDALRALTGHEGDGLVGTRVDADTFPDGATEIDAVREAMLDGELELLDREALLRRKDGAVRRVHATATLVREPDGAPRHFVVQLTDVTERQRSEEHLARSQRVAGIGSWEWDVATDRTTWSDGLYRLFDADPETHAPTYEGFLSILHPEDRGLIADAVDEVRAGRSDGYRLTVRIIRGDGAPLPVEVMAEAQRAPDGRLVRIVGVDRDVSRDLTAADEMATLRDELAEAHRLEAIGRLAGGVAHEVNNALTAIGGYAELVLGELAPGHPVRRDVESLHRVASEAASLPRQLLAFSRRQWLRPRDVDVEVAVADTEPLLRRVLAPCSLRRLPGAGGARAHFDPGQLQLVLVNLALNARDAMPHGGVVTIQAGRRALGAEESAQHGVAEGEYVTLSVADTGVGMDDETRRRALEPFFSTKDEPEHRGLGLATVFGVVRQSGGTVQIESRTGEGTVVEVLIPLAPETPRGATPSSPEETTVLVVEDQPAVRSVAERSLRAAGYRVVVAGSAEDARIVCRDEQVDLLVTDVKLGPGATGVELARELRDARPSLPVVLVSGYADVDIEPGDHVFLPKPFSPGDLQDAAARALGPDDGGDGRSG